MSRPWPAERLIADVERLAGRGLGREAFSAELGERVRRAVPVAGVCSHTVDPGNLLLTSFHAEGMPDALDRLVAAEYGPRDVLTFAELAKRRRPVGVLGAATGGRPERSPRYRSLLRPNGLGPELRAVFVTRGRAWGCLVLARELGDRDFTAGDAALFARLSKPLAEGFRSAVAVDAARRAGDPDAPGLVVLAPDGEVELTTPPALALLEELGPGAPLPTALLTVAASARRAGGPARVPAPSRRGGFIVLDASLADGRVAVVLRRAQPPETAALRLEASGLTPREREVAQLTVAGLSTAEIAERLVLSPHTVQDHMKAVYEKTGTRSRRELVGRVFFADYWEPLRGNAPLTADGAWARPLEFPRTSPPAGRGNLQA